MKFFYHSVILTILIIFGISETTYSQGCNAGIATQTLDATSAKITLSSTGIWSYDPSGKTAYEWPYIENLPFDGPGLISAGNFWIAGLDAGLNLKIAGKAYGQGNNNGFWPGPIVDNTIPSQQDCSNWDRLFKINRSEIESFLADYEDNQQFDDPIPTSILGWPARGNAQFSQVHDFDLPQTSSGLAPFFDTNGNGIYEPMSGDYPLIKCADQAVWWVFNDLGNGSFLNTDPVGIEVQMMAYVYDSPSSNLYNSSYYDIKTIYRGQEPLTDVYMGLWMDPNLGCPFDDYVGVVAEENLAFVYNGDIEDGLGGGNCQGNSTYLQEPPMMGIKMQRGPLNQWGEEIDSISSFIVYNNEDVNPTQASEFYNMMKGLRANGDVYVNPNNEISKFLYSGNPSNSPDEWSMCSEDAPLSDQRFFMTAGPIEYYLPGTTNLMTFTITVQPNSSLPCPDVTSLVNDVDLPIWTFNNFNENCELTVGVNEEMAYSIGLTVFPNPASDLLNFQLSENETFTTIRLYRLNGQLVRSKENLLTSKIIMERGDLSTGTYIYQIQTETGASVSGKIILE